MPPHRGGGCLSVQQPARIIESTRCGDDYRKSSALLPAQPRRHRLRPAAQAVLPQHPVHMGTVRCARPSLAATSLSESPDAISASTCDCRGLSRRRCTEDSRRRYAPEACEASAASTRSSWCENALGRYEARYVRPTTPPSLASGKYIAERRKAARRRRQP